MASRLAENVAGEALTHREETVPCLVVEGLCNKSIANRLGIASGTGKSNVRYGADTDNPNDHFCL